MGVRFPSVFAKSSGNVSLPSGTETTIGFTPPLTLPLDFAAVFICTWCTFTTGTATTAVSLLLRRGISSAGFLVNVNATQLTIAAATQGSLPLIYFDVPGAAGQVQYALDYTPTAATAAGTCQDWSILAFAL